MPDLQRLVRTRRAPHHLTCRIRWAFALLTVCACSLIVATLAQAAPQDNLRTPYAHLFPLAQVVAAPATTQEERERARTRAQEAIEQTGADTTLQKDATLQQMPVELREKPIPRKLDLDKLPNRGCSPSDGGPQLPGCGGCNQCNSCAGPAAAASSLSTIGQLIGALIGLVILIATTYLLYNFWQKRRYPTHRAFESGDLLAAARALSPTAVEDALASKNYNAAIHALFLRTLLQIHDKGYGISKSWTPREIVHRLQLRPDVREPLSSLVYFAERARFANHRATLEDFERAERAAQSVRAHLDKEQP